MSSLLSHWWRGLAVACVTLGLAVSFPLHSQEADPEEAKEKAIIERFVTVLEKNPRRGTALDKVYGYHVERGSLDGIIKAYREKIAQAKGAEAATAWMIVGLMESLRGQDAMAVKAFGEAESLDPASYLASYYLGQSLVLIGQPDKAAEALERATQRKPAPADQLDVYQALGRVYQRAQKSDKALEVWNRLEKQFPNDARVQEQIATTLLEEGEHAAALPRFESLAKLTKDKYRQSLFQMEAAEIKVKLGKGDDAKAEFEKLLGQLNPDNWLFREVRRRIENIYLRTDDQAGLIAYYEAWVKKNPEDLEAISRLSRLLAGLGRGPEAQSWLEKALKAAPTKKDLRHALIAQLMFEQKFVEVIAQYEQLDKHEPNNPDTLRDWGRVILKDTARDEATRKKDAAAVWRRLTVAKPKDPLVASQVAELFRSVEMTDEALELYQKAMALAPEAAQYKEYLGEYFHSLKRKDEAMTTWKQIAEGKSKTAANVARLAEVLSGFGYLAEAVEANAEACKLDPKEINLQIKQVDLLAQAEKHEDALKQLDVVKKLAANDEEREAWLGRELRELQALNTLKQRIEEVKQELGASTSSAPLPDPPRRGEGDKKSAELADKWFWLARAHEAQRELKEAGLAVTKASELAPQSIPILMSSARILEAQNNILGAVEVNTKLAAVDRRYRTEYLKKVAQLETQLGRREKAIQAGRDLIAAAPGNPELYEFFSQLCFGLGESEEGLQALRRSVRVNPTEPKGLLLLASALSEQFRTSESIELYWRAFDKAGNLEDRLGVMPKLTELYLQTNQFDRLLERLERQRREPNQQREMTICLAQAYQSAGDDGNARTELEKLLTDDTRDTQLLTQLVKLCESDGDLDVAVRYQQQLNKVTPGKEGTMRLAGLLMKAGEKDEATALMQQLTESEKDPEVILKTIDSLLTQKQFEQALTLVSKLTRDQPKNWELLYREGAALAGLHKSSGAKEGEASKQDEAAKRFETILALKLKDEDQSLAAKKAAAKAAKAPRGQAAMNPYAMQQQHSLQYRIQHVYTIRQAVRLDNQEYYGGGQQQQQPFWAPTDYGQVRMAAMAWQMSFAQTGGKLEEFFKQRKDSVEKATDRRDLIDWYYLASVKSDGKEQYKILKTLAMRPDADREVKQMYLYSLSQRGPAEGDAAVAAIDPNEAVAGDGSDDETDDNGNRVNLAPLSKEELEQVIAIAKEAESLTELGQHNWGVGTSLELIAGELKRAGRKEEAAKLYADALANAKEPMQIATVLQGTVQRGDYETALKLLDRLAELIAKQGTQTQTVNPNNFNYMQYVSSPQYQSQILCQLMSKRAQANQRSKKENVLDGVFPLWQRYLKLVAARDAAPAAQTPAAKKARAVNPYGNQNYFSIWRINGQQNGEQIDFPQPNDICDHATLQMLRQMFALHRETEQLPVLTEAFAAAAKDPETPASQRQLWQFCIGYLHWWNDEKDEALATLSDAIRQVPDSTELKFELARLHEKRREFAEALVLIDGLTPSDQAELQKREVMALRLAVNGGDIDRARAAADRLFGLRLDSQLQMALAKQMHQLGMHEQAEAVLARAGRQAGNKTDVLSGLMEQYASTGKNEVAIQIAHQLLRRSKPSGNAGQSRRNSNDGTDPTRNQALQVLNRSGKLPELIAKVESQLKNSPKSQRLLETLLEYHVAAGNDKKVEELNAKLSESKVDNPQFRYQLAMKLLDAGKTVEANEHLKIVFEKEPRLAMNNYYELQNKYEQHNKLEDLASLYEAIDLKVFRQNTHVITNAISNMANRDKTKDRSLKLFKKAWQDLPESRNELLSNMHDENFWKLPEIYDYAREGVIPSELTVQSNRFQGFGTSYSYGQDGKITTLYSRILDMSVAQKKLDTLGEDVAAGIKKMPTWTGGKALAAMIDLRKGKIEEGKAVFATMLPTFDKLSGNDVYYAGRAMREIGQELMPHEPCVDLAIKYFELAVKNDQDQNEFQYTAGKPLMVLLKKQGRKAEARQVLIDGMTVQDPGYNNPGYVAYRRVSNAVGIAKEFQDLGYPADAIKIYQKTLSNADDLQQSQQYGGSQYKKQLQDGLKKSLAELKPEALVELLTPAPKAKAKPKPANTGRSRQPQPKVEEVAVDPDAVDLILLLDSRELDKTKMSSALGNLIAGMTAQPAMLDQAKSALTEVRSKRPDDFGAAILATQIALATKDEALKKASVEELVALVERVPLDAPSDKGTFTAKQRSAAMQQAQLWLVARDCLKQEPLRSAGDTLAARALLAAKRQTDNAYALAILREWGQLALAAGDKPTAERLWGEMLEMVLPKPSEKKKKPVEPEGEGGNVGFCGTDSSKKVGWAVPTRLRNDARWVSNVLVSNVGWDQRRFDAPAHHVGAMIQHDGGIEDGGPALEASLSHPTEVSRLYSEGVASHSPGLPAQAGYPGRESAGFIYPERVASFELHQGRNPVGVRGSAELLPQGSSLCSQPWAVRQNSFGVNATAHSSSLPSAGRAGEGGGLADRLALAHRPPSLTLPAEGREQSANGLTPKSQGADAAPLRDADVGGGDDIDVEDGENIEVALSSSLPSAGRAGEGGGLAERLSLAQRPPSLALPAEGREQEGTRPSRQPREMSRWELMIAPALIGQLNILAVPAARSATSAAGNKSGAVTLAQFEQAAQIAKLAADNGLTELALTALTKALHGGPPLEAMQEVNANNPFGQAQQVNNNSQATIRVQLLLAQLESTLRQKGVDDATMYALLRGTVFPESRPLEAFLYTQPLASSPGNQPQSIGALLVRAAVKANKTDELKTLCEARLKQPLGDLAGRVLLAQLALATQDKAAMQEHLAQLTERLKLDSLQNTSELACHVALPAITLPDAPPIAVELVSQAVDRLHKSIMTQRGGGNTEPVTSLTFKLAGLHFQHGKQAEGTRLLDSYLAIQGPMWSNYGGDYPAYQRKLALLKVAGELARAGLKVESLDMFGRFADATTSRDYQVGGPGKEGVALLNGLASLKPAERYDLLKAWSLPTKDRLSVRFIASLISGDKTPAAFEPLRKSTPRAPRQTQFLSTADLLVSAAAATGKLKELQQELEPHATKNIENAKFLLLLTRLAQPDDAKIAADLLADIEVQKQADAEAAKNTSNRGRQRPDLSNAILAQVAVARDATRDAGLALTLHQFTRWSTVQDHVHMTAMRHLYNATVVGEARAAEIDTAPHEVGLAHWTGGAVAPASYVSGGAVPAWWLSQDGMIQHICGPDQSYLFFNTPLTGTFEFSCEVWLGGWAEGNAGYGGLVFDALNLGNTARIYPVGYRNDALSKPDPLEKQNHFNRITIRVSPDKIQHLVNGVLIHDEKTTGASTSPWLLLQADRVWQTVYRDLRITGSPEIPREVKLTNGSSLLGWSSAFYAENQARHFKVENQNVNDEFGNESGSTQRAPDLDWWAVDGEIHGRRITSSGLAKPSVMQSRLQYCRPLRSGDSLKYEFWYEPGAAETHVHPALDRLAMILDPEGVKLHWMTESNDGLATAGLPNDNLLDRAFDRHGEGLLPLKERDWNSVSLTLKGDVVTVSLNDKAIYERTLEPDNDRQFGFYHDKSSTAVRVRNVVLTGDWPKSFAPELAANLTASSRQPTAEERQRVGRTFEDKYAAASVDQVVLQTRALPPAERYAALLDWVLPNDNHTTLRLYGEFTPADVVALSKSGFSESRTSFRAASQGGAPSGDGATSAEGSPARRQAGLQAVGRRTRSGGELIAPAIELVALAKGLDKLPELVAAVEKVPETTPQLKRGRYAMLVLMSIAAEDFNTAAAVLQELTPNRNPGLSDDLAQSDRWPEVIAAYEAMHVPQLRPATVALLDVVLDSINRKGIGHEWDVIVRSGRQVAKMMLDKNENDLPPASGLSPKGQWAQGTLVRATTRGSGLIPRWRFEGNTAQHLGGHGNDLLFYQSPLRGKFTVEADLSSHGWREARLMYGCNWAAPQYTLEVSDIGNLTTNWLGPKYATKLEPLGDFYRVTLEVTPDKAVYHLQGRAIHETTLGDDCDPWLAVHTFGQYAGEVRSLRILGEPQIPDELHLSKRSDLQGWFGDVYGDSMLVENAMWRKNGDEIVGQKIAGMEGRSRESLLQYHRPMLEDGEITYDFFHVPGQTLVHPALGRLALLLADDGVKVHWLTDAQFERTGLAPDNVSVEQEHRRGPAKLPLKANDWNQLSLKVTGDTLALALNGESVYERPIEPSNLRTFGLFHYAGDTDVRVKNVIYRGHWPKSLPSIKDQEFAGNDLELATFKPGELPATFAWNFQGEAPRGLIPTGADSVAKRTPEVNGMRVTRLPGAGPHEAGYQLQNLSIKGDFVLTLGYRDFQSKTKAINKDWQSPRVEIMLPLGGNYGEPTHTHSIAFTHRRLPNEALSLGVISGANGSDWAIQGFPQPKNEGRLRIVRRGAVCYFLTAPLGSDDWQVLERRTVTTGVVGNAIFGVRAELEGDESSCVLTEFSIQSAQWLTAPGLSGGASVPSLHWNGEGPQPAWLQKWSGELPNKFEPVVGGIQITRPQDPKQKTSPVGFNWSGSLKGDFEATLSYRDFESQSDKSDWQAPRVELHIPIGGANDSPQNTHTAQVGHRRPADGKVILTGGVGERQADGNKAWKTDQTPTQRTAGRMRLVRLGSMLYSLHAEAGSDNFTVLGSRPASAAEVKSLSFTLRSESKASSASAVFTEISIRAAELNSQEIKAVTIRDAMFGDTALPARLTWNCVGDVPKFLRVNKAVSPSKIEPTDKGLKLTRGANVTKGNEVLSVQWNGLIQGDFEITADYRDYTSTTTGTDWKVPRVELTSYLYPAGAKDHTYVAATYHERQATSEAILGQVGTRQPDNQFKWTSDLVPQTRSAGRLRLSRKGNRVYHLTAPADSNDWVLIGYQDLNPTELRQILLQLQSADPASTATAVFTNVTIRAEKIE